MNNKTKILILGGGFGGVECKKKIGTLLISWNNCAPCHRINEEECKRNRDRLIRSYTYEDQRSNARIDIDITAGTGPSGQSFYMVSLFA